MYNVNIETLRTFYRKRWASRQIVCIPDVWVHLKRLQVGYTNLEVSGCSHSLEVNAVIPLQSGSRSYYIHP
jgi:hypothetical protein